MFDAGDGVIEYGFIARAGTRSPTGTAAAGLEDHSVGLAVLVPGCAALCAGL